MHGSFWHLGTDVWEMKWSSSSVTKPALFHYHKSFFWIDLDLFKIFGIAFSGKITTQSQHRFLDVTFSGWNDVNTTIMIPIWLINEFLYTYTYICVCVWIICAKKNPYQCHIHLLGLVSQDLHDIQVVGLEFIMYNMKAFIHHALNELVAVVV